MTRSYGSGSKQRALPHSAFLLVCNHRIPVLVLVVHSHINVLKPCQLMSRCAAAGWARDLGATFGETTAQLGCMCQAWWAGGLCFYADIKTTLLLLPLLLLLLLCCQVHRPL
jgi:hypothetical protein